MFNRLQRQRRKLGSYGTPILVAVALFVVLVFVLPSWASIRSKPRGGKVSMLPMQLPEKLPLDALKPLDDDPELTKEKEELTTPSAAIDYVAAQPPPAQQLQQQQVVVVAEVSSPSSSVTAAPPPALLPAQPSVAGAAPRKTHWTDWKTLPGQPFTNARYVKATTHPVGKPPKYAPGETAIITLAAGKEHTKLVIALIQSLRDVGTSLDHHILVLAVRFASAHPDCYETEWKKKKGREHINCNGPETNAEELLGERNVEILTRLGAIIRVVNPIPSTDFTSGIAGGRQSFWGMSLNRMMIWNFTEYKKIVWMDGDTIVVKNVDHLFGYPTFTSSITHACCSNNGYGIPSGGVWILEPNLELGELFWKMMMEGTAEYNTDGTPMLTPEGNHLHATWRQSDMMLVRHAFCTWDRNRKWDQLWPKIFDDRHGYPVGMRDLPLYAAMTDEQFYGHAVRDAFTGKPMVEGLDPEKWDGKSIIWHTLPIHFDQCIPNCDCIPWRTNLSAAYSFHYTCMPGDTVSKPSQYETEEQFMLTVNGPKGTNCIRYFYRDLWYSKYVKAAGRLPSPVWDPADSRTKPTNMSALEHPPTWIYETDYDVLTKINGWGRRRMRQRRR